MEQDGDEDRIRLILYLAGLLEDPLSDKKFEDFASDQVELDLTAFRLGHVGEAAKRLSETVKYRHPEIDWTTVAAFRNVMFHDYLGLSPAHIWKAVKDSLPVLVTVARLELKRFEQ